jgi:hypothetical protein
MSSDRTGTPAFGIEGWYLESSKRPVGSRARVTFGTKDVSTAVIDIATALALVLLQPAERTRDH